MSLRRKALLVFLAVNALTVAGLLVYALREGSRARGEQAEREQALARAESKALAAVELLKQQLREFIARELAALLDEGLGEPELLLRIRAIPLFDQPIFSQLVEKAVLLKSEASGLALPIFNLRRRYIFDEGTLDKREAVEMVERSLRTNTLVERGPMLAGPLRARGREWGGFYLKLTALSALSARIPGDPTVAVRNLVLILLPGTLFLLWFLWYFLSRGVIDPLEELGRVARAVSRGDYSRRLPVTGRRDEIGRLVVVVNRMLELLEEYRDLMEAKVEDKTREIERKNRELMLGQRLAATGTLAAGIAHEINNPLGGMLNAARRLRRSDLSEDQKETYVALLEECIGRIGGIVQKVLALSPRQMTPMALDLHEEVRKTMELVGHRAHRKGVTLDLRLDGPAPRILGGANEVGQVFLNLLINGIDAGREGGTVRLRMATVSGQAVVVVEDDGVGMEPEVAARAFDMFFTTKPAGEGTGLGLATVHNLVTALGGSLELWTRPGEGTRFTVRLPLAGAAPADQNPGEPGHG